MGFWPARVTVGRGKKKGQIPLAPRVVLSSPSDRSAGGSAAPAGGRSAAGRAGLEGRRLAHRGTLGPWSRTVTGFAARQGCEAACSIVAAPVIRARAVFTPTQPVSYHCSLAPTGPAAGPVEVLAFRRPRYSARQPHSLRGLEHRSSAGVGAASDGHHLAQRWPAATLGRRK